MHAYKAEAELRAGGDEGVSAPNSPPSLSTTTRQTFLKICSSYDVLLAAAGLMREDLGNTPVVGEEYDWQFDLQQFQVQVGALIENLHRAASRASKIQTLADRLDINRSAVLGGSLDGLMIGTKSESNLETQCMDNIAEELKKVQHNLEDLKTTTLKSFSPGSSHKKVLQGLCEAALEGVQDLGPLRELVDRWQAATPDIHEEEEVRAALIQSKHRADYCGKQVAEAKMHQHELTESMTGLQSRQDTMQTFGLESSPPITMSSWPSVDTTERQRLDDLLGKKEKLEMELAAHNSQVFVCYCTTDADAPKILEQLRVAIPAIQPIAFEPNGYFAEVGATCDLMAIVRYIRRHVVANISIYCWGLGRRSLTLETALKNFSEYEWEIAGLRTVTIWICDGFRVGALEVTESAAKKFHDQMEILTRGSTSRTGPLKGSAAVGLTKRSDERAWPILQQTMTTANGGLSQFQLPPLICLEQEGRRWTIPELTKLQEFSGRGAMSKACIQQKLEQVEELLQKQRTPGSELFGSSAKECGAALARGAKQQTELLRDHCEVQARNASQDITEQLAFLEKEEKNLRDQVERYSAEKKELDEKAIPDLEASLASLHKRNEGKHMDQQARLADPLAAANNLYEHVVETQHAYESFVRCCCEALQVPATGNAKRWNVKAVNYYREILGVDVTSEKEDPEELKAKIVDHILSQLGLTFSPELLGQGRVVASCFCLSDLCSVEPLEFQKLLSSAEDVSKSHKMQMLKQQADDLSQEIAGLASLASLASPTLHQA